MEDNREKNEEDDEDHPSPCGHFCHLRRSFRPPPFIDFPEGNQVLYGPQPICEYATVARCLKIKVAHSPAFPALAIL